MRFSLRLEADTARPSSLDVAKAHLFDASSRQRI
jgi:hypothetical protein